MRFVWNIWKFVYSRISFWSGRSVDRTQSCEDCNPGSTPGRVKLVLSSEYQSTKKLILVVDFFYLKKYWYRTAFEICDFFTSFILAVSQVVGTTLTSKKTSLIFLVVEYVLISVLFSVYTSWFILLFIDLWKDTLCKTPLIGSISFSVRKGFSNSCFYLL